MGHNVHLIELADMAVALAKKDGLLIAAGISKYSSMKNGRMKLVGINY